MTTLSPEHSVLSIVIPSYNEIATIEALVERVQATPWKKELIIVDDGSSDGTRAVLAKLEAQDNVQVILHERNQGKGAALATGFAAAQGDIVLIQDADLEYDPKDYGKLLQPIFDGKADVVYGSRFVGSDSHRVIYFWHSIGNRMLTLTSNWL